MLLDCHCVEGAAYLCNHCIVHRGQLVKSLEEDSVKKELLSNVLKELSTSKAETEDNIQSLNKESQYFQSKQGLSRKVSMVFEILKKHMDTIEKRVLSEISRQVEEASGSYQAEIQEMEAKKKELSRKMAPIMELCAMTDPITVLERMEPEVGGVDGNPQETTADCRKAARDMDEGLISQILHTGLAELVVTAHSTLFMDEESNILLDENTMGNNLLLLPDNKSFVWSKTQKSKPKTPGRFRDHQVLSSTSFSTGRHFWTVETSKIGNWRFGVSYGSIARKGFRSYIGCNDKSWGLCKWNNQYSAMHACKVTKIPDRFTCQRFGVYLDYEAGHLSFYELCNPIRHLYTFNTIFTEPLFGVFRLWLDSNRGETWMSLRTDRLCICHGGAEWF
ncbi:tripartite motif-containing protein 14-like [Hyla sarda]|uniref:tripartite motif-containing protein 14-like n=1 Tax=Hyla sarda TaxID=327740 RepID=UPI0024C2CB6D|nr:tripartite motif-containing protein 14-like [Hyla sarda]